ncbi:methionine adenosyltransferase [Youngiibacter fragilis]|uniref:Methionine adenosyltransferase n=1 Tax=Youngiibacter fragilis 232.1 TaxID=994573 RepID=V7I2Z5_9CLOT|nr:methionine adenosyltransferase [Youngiibacter fragilis]ETA80595.1 S-adenosylmethionine synthetase [Youngiibacter fragilis 232.1]
MESKFLTAESVCEGHPDKLCDLIADSVLDACLSKDSASRVACEVMATKGKIIVAGEITCSGKIDIKRIVRYTLQQVGYDPRKFRILVFVHKQSPDIANGVDNTLEYRNGNTSWYGSLGAGDQGTMYGYATNETRQMLPLPVVLVNSITKRLDQARHDGLIKGIRPDGKAQVTVEYQDGKPNRVKTIVVSVQHDASKTLDELTKDIYANVLWKCFEDFPFDENTEILINPSGRFVEGGPAADTGLTGRKLMVDTYGGLAAHGGGAFSGKDPTKVDRSAAYMARNIAKHIVWCDFAERCQVNIAYAIGKADPVSVEVDTFETGKVPDEFLRKAVMEVWCLRPAAIIELLNLRFPRYSETAVYGHFSSCLYPWENVGKYKELEEVVKKYEQDNQ